MWFKGTPNELILYRRVSNVLSYDSFIYWSWLCNGSFIRFNELSSIKPFEILVFNMINPNTVPYMTYSDFIRYIRRKGIVASSIAIELVYKRLNKAHNNKLSIYDLSNELTSI